MAAEDYDIKIKYLSAKAKRQGGKLDLQDVAEFHSALIAQLQLEMLRQGQEIGKLQTKIKTLEKKAEPAGLAQRPELPPCKGTTTVRPCYPAP